MNIPTMLRVTVAAGGFALAAQGSEVPGFSNAVIKAELLRRTQELFDSVAAGTGIPGSGTSPTTACILTRPDER